MKKVKTPYFQGDPVSLKFEVRGTSGDIEPSSAEVEIYTNEREPILSASAEVEGNVVSYAVPEASTQDAGNYRAVFTVSIPPDITKTHIIRFHIASKGIVISEEEDPQFMPLDEASDEYETEGAISSAIRQLRRAGHAITEAARISRDLAEKMTGRRI